MKILILGSTGLLGSNLSINLRNSPHEIITHSYRAKNTDVSADITCFETAEKILTKIAPNVVINLIALSDVDECERNPEKAYSLNVQSTKNITSFIKKYEANIRLIQISTDQVYNGKGQNSEDEINLLNNYAVTKHQSEKAALDCNSIVLRTNFFGKSHNPQLASFSDWVISSLDDEGIRFFDDIYFNPLHMDTLSSVILKILDNKSAKGIYNVGSKDGMSKFEFADQIARKMNLILDKQRSISIDEIDLSAQRPKSMITDVSKFENDFNFTLPNLKDEIEKLFE